MSIIRIFANTIELDIVKDTLTIKKENNSFGSDFRVSHSSFPFLIVENEKTNRALGNKEMASVLKKKVVPIVVLEMGERYNGELQIISYNAGFRKCNIRYGVEPLDIMDKKLSDMLPIVSVIPGETNSVPYTEENISIVDGYLNWGVYPIQFAGKIFPEVKFQFPELAWKNKFFEDAPEEDDEWFMYEGYYNKFKAGPAFVENGFMIAGDQGQLITIFNRSVPSPQLFMLAPLEYSFGSIGWKIDGDFVNSEFAKRLLLLSIKNNLCKVDITPDAQLIGWNDLEDFDQLFYHYYKYDLVVDASGTYTFFYDILEPLRSGGITSGHYSSKLFYQVNPGFILDNQMPVYGNVNDPENLRFTGSFEVTISDEEVGTTIRLVWARFIEGDPNPIEFQIRWSNESKPFQMMHPTIELGRYVPDWTLSTYINEIKNKFCLQVDFDNINKVATFNYASDQVTKGNPYVLKNSLAITEFDTSQYTAFILKNTNDEDTTLYIDRDGVFLNKTSTSELTSIMESQFKLVPTNGYTADISQMEDKDGVGLMIYNPQGEESFEVPVIVSDYNGQTLSWEGALGIYNLYFKNFIRFRLNASSIELSGSFTEHEISIINRLKKIHTGHQAYMVVNMEYSETLQDNYTVKFKLESINF